MKPPTPSDLPGPAPGSYAELWRVAYPLIISTGSMTLMQFCDRLFLAWHSAAALQAALPASILSFTIFSGFMALCSYSGTFVSQFHGAGDSVGCARATAQSVLLGLICWPAVLALIPPGMAVLRWSGHGPEVLALEMTYFGILTAGSLPTLLSAGLSGFFSGRGDTRTTMIAHVAGNLLNIVLDYWFIFGGAGLPAMGIRGAALATVISSLLPLAIFAALYFSPKAARSFGTRSTFRIERALMRRLVRFGLPSGLHLALDLASFTLFILVTGRLGPVALAASNIALSVNTLAFMPVIGLSIAASIVVGQYQGCRQPDVSARSAANALRLGVLYMLAIGLTYALFPRFYVALFTDRGPDALGLSEVLPTATPLLVFLALWSAGDACVLVLSGALKGAGDTRFAMGFSLALAWGFFVPGVFAAVFLLPRGQLFAAWAWTLVYVFLLAAGFLLRFRSGRWKNIDLLGRERPIEPVRPGAEALVVE